MISSCLRFVLVHLHLETHKGLLTIIITIIIVIIIMIIIIIANHEIQK